MVTTQIPRSWTRSYLKYKLYKRWWLGSDSSGWTPRNLPVWSVLSRSKLVSRPKPRSLFPPQFCHLTDSATSKCRLASREEGTVCRGADPVWLAPLPIAAGTCVLPRRHPLRERGCPHLPRFCCSPGSWPSFLVPTHSGSELRSFRNAAAIAALQDEAQLTLNSYIHTRWLVCLGLQKTTPVVSRRAGRSGQFQHWDSCCCQIS